MNKQKEIHPSLQLCSLRRVNIVSVDIVDQFILWCVLKSNKREQKVTIKMLGYCVSLTFILFVVSIPFWNVEILLHILI